MQYQRSHFARRKLAYRSKRVPCWWAKVGVFPFQVCNFNIPGFLSAIFDQVISQVVQEPPSEASFYQTYSKLDQPIVLRFRIYISVC